MAGRGTSHGPGGRDLRRPGSGHPPRPAGRPAARPSASPRPRRSADSAPSPRPLWRGLLPDAAGNRRIFRLAVLVSIVAFLAVLLVPTLRAYLSQRSEIGALRSKVASQEAAIAQLQREQGQWTDPAYVEQQARERLKFVMPGEKAYTVLDAKPSAPAIPVLNSPTGLPSNLPWYGSMWASVGAADASGHTGR